MTPQEDPEAELLALYREESREALRVAGRRLNSLSKAGKARKIRLLDSLRAAGHRLKGSGGTYGLAEVSRRGAELEALMKAALAGTRRPDAAFRAEARGLLDSLLASFRS